MATGRVVVVAVGVSRFDGPGVDRPDRRPLPFAAADARAFADAVRPHAAVRLLTDADATAAALRAALVGLGDLGPDDAAVVFAVTHADRDGGGPLLAAADGLVPLRETLRPVWEGPAKRVVLLFDVGRSESTVSAGEFAVLFPPRPGRALALADDGRSGSHVSGELQAGVWAAAVTAAFGETPRFREADGRLTVGSLRAALAEELPRSLARAYADGRTQSPVLIALSEGETLADPPPVAPAEPRPPLAGVRFFSEREVPVKTLGGFRKGVHSPPTDTLGGSREWVARLAEPDLAKEVEEAAGRLRRHLGYKRRDVRADGPAAGAASVLTPDFAYHLTATQHPAKPGTAVFRRTLADVRDAAALARPGIAEAFPQGFASLHRPFETPADVAAVIDAIEDAEPAAVVRIDYPTDLSRVDLELAGFDGGVRIDPTGLTVTPRAPAPPADLARCYRSVIRLLAGSLIGCRSVAGTAGVPTVRPATAIARPGEMKTACRFPLELAGRVESSRRSSNGPRR